jgi:hypothetical protein
MRERPGDPRLWRLFDLARDETIVIRCPCEHGNVSFGPGELQRRRRVPSDTLIYDLQYRMRRQRCGRTQGFTITVLRLRTDRSQLSGERTTETVIVSSSD